MKRKYIVFFLVFCLIGLTLMNIPVVTAQSYEDFTSYTNIVHANHTDFWHTFNPYISWSLELEGVSQSLNISENYFSYNKTCKYTLCFHASISADYTIIFSLELEFEEVEIGENKIKLKYKDDDFEFESEFNWFDMVNMSDFDFEFSHVANSTGFYFWATDFILEGTNVLIDPNYEDFTTYGSDPHNDPNNRISLVGTNHIDFYSTRLSADHAYLHKDYGGGFFTDFIHSVDIRTDFTSGTSLGFTWVLSNTKHDWRDMLIITADAIGIRFYEADNSLSLVEMDSGVQYLDSYSASGNTWYFLDIIKTGTNLTCNIYSNAPRTTLLDTLYLNLHSDWSFRYVYGVCGYGGGPVSQWQNIDVENLDLHLSVHSVTFYNNSGGILRVNNATVTNGTQIIFVFGSIIELASLPQNSSYLFSYFEWDISSSTTNPYDLTIPSNLTVWCYFLEVEVGYAGFSFLFFGLIIGLVLGAILLIAKKTT